MAIITKDPVSKGSSSIFTLNKTELGNHSDVSGDAYFSDQDNWYKVFLYYQSSTGNQKEIVQFDATQYSPTGTFHVSSYALDEFEIYKLTIFDFDGGSLSIPRANLTVADFDVSFAAVAWPSGVDGALSISDGGYVTLPEGSSKDYSSISIAGGTRNDWLAFDAGVGDYSQAGGEYITFSSSSTDYYLWWNDGASSDPNIGGRTGIEVDIMGVSSNDELASDTLLALRNAISDSEYLFYHDAQIVNFYEQSGTNVSNPGSELTNSEFIFDLQEAGGSNKVTFEKIGIEVDGSNLPMDGDYFELPTPYENYYYFFDFSGGDTEVPSEIATENQVHRIQSNQDINDIQTDLWNAITNTIGESSTVRYYGMAAEYLSYLDRYVMYLEATRSGLYNSFGTSFGNIVINQLQNGGGGVLQISGSDWTSIGCLGDMTNNGRVEVTSGDAAGGTFSDTAPDGESLSYSITQTDGGDGGTFSYNGGSQNSGNGGGGAGSGIDGGDATSTKGGDGGDTSSGLYYSEGATLWGTSALSADPDSEGGFAGGGGGGSRGYHGGGLYIRVGGNLEGEGEFDVSGREGGNGGAGSTEQVSGDAGSGGGGGAGGSGGKIVIKYEGSNNSNYHFSNEKARGGFGGKRGDNLGGGSQGTDGDNGTVGNAIGTYSVTSL